MKDDLGVAAGEAALKELVIATALLDEHYRWSDKAHSGKFNEFGIEAKKRMQQLQLLLTKTILLLEEASDIQAKIATPNHKMLTQDWEQALQEWQGRAGAEDNRLLMKRSSKILGCVHLTESIGTGIG